MVNVHLVMAIDEMPDRRQNLQSAASDEKESGLMENMN
jgi:hypothetical protein